MKKIYCNLKRFDVPAEMGGVNRLGPVQSWGGDIVAAVQDGLAKWQNEAEFAIFFPEAHLLHATTAKKPGSPLQIGCQSVYRENVSPGGNFGAFTANRPAASAKALGCTATIIGHCEERRDKAGILAEAGVTAPDAVDRILNQQAICALDEGLNVLFCIGETEQEHGDWQAVLENQLTRGLNGLDTARITIAYEPVWAIGPGKTPPGADYIREAAQHIKSVSGGLSVVYGGGLKTDNAAMLASIEEIDGGLIALTRFTGEIGFYPDEYLEIVRTYLKGE